MYFPLCIHPWIHVSGANRSRRGLPVLCIQDAMSIRCRTRGDAFNLYPPTLVDRGKPTSQGATTVITEGTLRVSVSC